MGQGEGAHILFYPPFLAVDPAQAFLGVWVNGDEVQKSPQRTSSDGRSSSSSLFDADLETELALLELERKAQGNEVSHGNHNHASVSLNSMVRHPYRRTREFDVSDFEDFLRDDGPFAASSPLTSTELSFRTLFEIARVALHCGIPYSELITSVKNEPADYEALWSPLSFLVKNYGRSMPERSNSETWHRADRYEEGVPCSGKLKLKVQGSEPLLSLQLNSFTFRKPNRFTRKYGYGRIFELDVPCFSYKEQLPPALEKNLEATRSVFNDWMYETNHLFLGRQWRAFFSKPNKPKGDLNHNNEATSSNRVYLFAERGHGIPASDEMSVNHIVEWFVPAQKNAKNTVLKLFYRISQGLTPTSATTIFQSDQIIRTHDAFSKRHAQRCLKLDSHDERGFQTGIGESQNENLGNVMNDGCARISIKAHEAVAERLGLQRPFPSVYQGRIAGAKGTWMKDPIGETTRLDDPFWIEITDSQFKFETSLDEDALHRTLEVVEYSRPLSSARINTHLVSILIDRGVPLDVLEDLMRESMNSEVARFEAAMEDALEMRKWIQEHNGKSITEGRLMHQSIKVTGAVPFSIPERIIWFLEHGFEPRRCQELGKLCRMELKLLLENHVRKLKIRVGQSASAFVIADPLGVLEPNEIHVGFSGSFVDEASGFEGTFLDGMEVLVARHPALLPSDIQKARAVFNKALAEIKDVFIFSIKGSRPLVSLLSGGDHDGDMPWLCWDERVVRPFENVETPSERSAQHYNIPVDQEKVSETIHCPEFVTKFLQKGLKFNSQPDFLGMAANYHEALCYYRNSISDESTIDLGCLLGLLVDFRKGGLSFTMKIFEDWKISHDLLKHLETPCYKSLDEPPKIINCLDKLTFQTVKSIQDRALEDFEKKFKDTGSYDSDLSELWKSEEQKWDWAKKDLKSQFENLISFHNEHCLRDSYQSGHETKNEDRPAALDQLRDMFLQIEPPVEKPCDMTSDTKAAWQRLKASFLYYRHPRGAFVWHACGEELGELKIDACGGGRRVVHRLHLPYKPDVKLIKQLDRTTDE